MSDKGIVTQAPYCEEQYECAGKHLETLLLAKAYS